MRIPSLHPGGVKGALGEKTKNKKKHLTSHSVQGGGTEDLSQNPQDAPRNAKDAPKNPQAALEKSRGAAGCSSPRQ